MSLLHRIPSLFDTWLWLPVIKCQCGYNETIPLSSYLHFFNTKNNNRFYSFINKCSIHNEVFSPYCYDCHECICSQCESIHKHSDYFDDLSFFPNNISKAEEHLQYLSALKNKFSSNEQIESLYKKCYSVNQDILSLCKIFIEIYHNDSYVLRELVKRTITLIFINLLMNLFKAYHTTFPPLHFITASNTSSSWLMSNSFNIWSY